MRDMIDGSSPHTRGTQLLLKSVFDAVRFIPAHAGNTAIEMTTLAIISVHPRTRGEHELLSACVYNYSGSSPHTRGTRVIGIKQKLLTRFIPAHAGNTFKQDAVKNWEAVHPRTRGEHSNYLSSNKHDSGSSPHTRGTHLI